MLYVMTWGHRTRGNIPVERVVGSTGVKDGELDRSKDIGAKET